VPVSWTNATLRSACFGNIAVHQDKELDLEVLPWVAEAGHWDFVRLGQRLKRRSVTAGIRAQVGTDGHKPPRQTDK
jgi:hypothetical protein